MRPSEHAHGALESAPRTASGRPLHVCARCDSRLVHPLRWKQLDGRWTVWRRCPDCEWRDAGSFDQGALDAFDDVLEQGAAALTRDLRVLARANMAEDVERFVRALAAGAILPEDF